MFSSRRLRTVAAQAFSLVEVLAAVAVIGVLAGVAISFLGGNHRETFMRARDMRNAQEIASLTMGGTAAGAAIIENGDMLATIQNLVEGRICTVGAFKGRIFRLPGLTEEEIAGAVRHLVWEDNMISYAPDHN